MNEKRINVKTNFTKFKKIFRHEKSCLGLASFLMIASFRSHLNFRYSWTFQVSVVLIQKILDTDADLAEKCLLYL